MPIGYGHGYYPNYYRPWYSNYYSYYPYHPYSSPAYSWAPYYWFYRPNYWGYYGPSYYPWGSEWTNPNLGWGAAGMPYSMPNANPFGWPGASSYYYGQPARMTVSTTGDCARLGDFLLAWPLVPWTISSANRADGVR